MYTFHDSSTAPACPSLTSSQGRGLQQIHTAGRAAPCGLLRPDPNDKENECTQSRGLLLARSLEPAPSAAAAATKVLDLLRGLEVHLLLLLRWGQRWRGLLLPAAIVEVTTATT